MSREEEKYYQIVYDELITAGTKKGLWLQSLTEANGDEVKAKVIYVKYRVAQLKEDERIKRQTETDSNTVRVVNEYYTVICPKCSVTEKILIRDYKLPGNYKQFNMTYNAFIGKVNLSCIKCGMKFGIESQFIQ